MTISTPLQQIRDPGLRDRVKNALDETRTMILGVQILLGFQYQVLFYPAFERLPGWGRDLDAAALGLTAITAALLLACIPYHRLAERGDDTMRLVDHASLMAGCALATLALAVGADFTLIMEHAMSPLAAWLSGGLALLVCLGFWFFYGLAVGRGSARKRRDMRIKASLEDRISLMLTESRVILPGCQALLGIQLVAVFSDGFQKLEPSSRAIHLVCLGLLGLAMVMLLAPAAYHRLAANGDASEGTDRFGVRMILGALVPLGLGMAGDFYVVVRQISDSPGWGAGAGAALLLFMLVLWLGWPLAARTRR